MTKSKSKSSRHSQMRKPIRFLIFACVLVLAAVITMTPLNEKITMGLDIDGGVSAVLKATTVDGSTPTQEQMDEASGVISARVNASGASNTSVQQQGSDQFLVQIPGADNSTALLDTLSSQGVLEFVDVSTLPDISFSVSNEDSESEEQESQSLKDLINSGVAGINLKALGLQYEPFMTGEDVDRTSIAQTTTGQGYAVNLKLNGEGTKAFADVSTALLPTNGRIAILLDGVVQSAPAVQAAITTGDVQITGNYTIDEAESLQNIINSGSLPVSLSVEQSSVVGPTLGQDALMSGILAALIGLAIVFIWLIFFYRGMGLIASISVLVMSVLYIGLLAAFSIAGWFSLTLPGIAGIIINIGLAADSSILIMECFHEHVREGKSFASAAKSGVKEGIMTSLDADIVTLVTALILYFVAVGDVRGFGFTLALGIICDLIVMVLFTAPVMRIFGPKVMQKHPVFFGMDDDMHEGEYIRSLNYSSADDNSRKLEKVGA